jgi:hypothetical protein
VAGKGVRLTADTENNRWVVEADETVLWENAAGDGAKTGITLSESYKNFEYLLISYKDNNSIYNTNKFPVANDNAALMLVAFQIATGSNTMYTKAARYTLSSTSITWLKELQQPNNSTTATWVSDPQLKITKVVGINRVASA